MKQSAVSPKMKELLIAHVAAFILMPVAGLLLLLTAFLLPAAPMQEHVYWSLDMLEKEFEDELLIDGFPSTLTGNFTDCLMLEQAVYTGGEHTVLDRALHIYRGESYYDPENPEGWQPGRSLVDYLTGVPQPQEVEYGRYWHGYLIFLKPLLLVTSFNSIRFFFGAFQLFLVGLVVLLMARRGESGLAAAYLISMPFLHYFSTYASLSQSVCLYGMLLAVIVMLVLDARMEKKKNVCLFFLFTGMLTSYFDLLTYPLVTLCYPLGVYLYLRGRTLRENLKDMAAFSIEWALGYVWMWGTKWILADLLTGGSVVRNALENVACRTQNADGYGKLQGFFHVVSLNLQPFGNRGLLLFAGMLMTGIFFLGIRNRKHLKYMGAANAVTFLCLAAYPFGWWFLTQNHSEEHWIFTCRIFAITVFACFAELGKTFSADMRTTH